MSEDTRDKHVLVCLGNYDNHTFFVTTDTANPIVDLTESGCQLEQISVLNLNKPVSVSVHVNDVLLKDSDDREIIRLESGEDGIWDDESDLLGIDLGLHGVLRIDVYDSGMNRDLPIQTIKIGYRNI